MIYFIIICVVVIIIIIIINFLRINYFIRPQPIPSRPFSIYHSSISELFDSVCRPFKDFHGKNSIEQEDSLTSKPDLNLREKLAEFYTWILALHDVEWPFRNRAEIP
jgi:hypothetical protein